MQKIIAPFEHNQQLCG